jgi:hypothetical protein
VERAHILSRLERYEEALVIFVSQLRDIKAAEDYCKQHYSRSDAKRSHLFSTLFRLQHGQGIKNITDTLSYLNSHGYRMDANFVSDVNHRH